MKRFYFALIIISFFFISAFAQSNQIAPCPEISVLGPAGIPAPYENINFIADIGQTSDKFNLIFNWKISSSEIIDGQGTKQIKVLGQDFCNKSMIATLEIQGLPNNCQNTYSENFSIACCVLNPVQIDEFSISVKQIDKVKLNNLAKEARNNQSAQIYIIEKFEEKTSSKTIKLKNQNTIDFLMMQGIERERITLLNGKDTKSLTQFFLVPAGATPPICEDCVTVK